MKRDFIIQNALKKLKGNNYLEIGVCDGGNFYKIKAKNKIAVDPCFIIPNSRKWKGIFTTINGNFFQTTSDYFFEVSSSIFKNAPIDVAFVDGLHTYEQSLQDVENCLNHLRPDGIIVMHDCYPPNAPAANRDQQVAMKMEGYSDEWCGDVWKTIVHLRALKKDLEVCVLDTDYGIGLIKRGNPKETLDFTEDQIKSLDYSTMVVDKEKILNLKPKEYLWDFLA